MRSVLQMPGPATEAAHRERRLRRLVRTSLACWAGLALNRQGHVPAAHHRLLMHELERLSRGDMDRLMVLLPPGSAKSTYASVLFPAWWFVQHPRSSVIAAAHTRSLADHFGRSARGLIEEHCARLGYRLSQASRSAGRFTTDQGGHYFATGVRGSVTGRRADLLIVDDPIRSQMEADSAVARERTWSWFRSDLVTRLRPQGRVLLVMTRWHQDDLAGRLLEEGGWHVLRLPALADALDPLGRQPGEALWPEWEDATALARKRQMIGERAFSALFQQAPLQQHGRLFQVGRVETLAQAPCQDGCPVVRAWDLAATAAGSGNPDWTVGLKLMRDRDGRFVVLDVVRLRATPGDVVAAIVATAAADGREVGIGLPQDPGQAGKAQAQFLAAKLAGSRLVVSPDTGAKEVRAMPVASQVEVGGLRIVKADWNRALLDELADFPFGTKDDQVDALSRAFAMLTDTLAPARFTRLNLTVR